MADSGFSIGPRKRTGAGISLKSGLLLLLALFSFKPHEIEKIALRAPNLPMQCFCRFRPADLDLDLDRSQKLKHVLRVET